jgi:hypothetical protein
VSEGLNGRRMIVIDTNKLRDYKGCSRGILVAFCGCGSHWLRSGFRCFEKISALDGVLKPSSPLTGSTGVDRGLGKVWRRPWCRFTVMLLGGVGVLAFLMSAILPDDDTLQQEFFHSRISVRCAGRHSREAAGNAASVHPSTAFWPAAKPLLVLPCGTTYRLCLAAPSGCGEIRSTTRASRAPPASV